MRATRQLVSCISERRHNGHDLKPFSPPAIDLVNRGRQIILIVQNRAAELQNYDLFVALHHSSPFVCASACERSRMTSAGSSKPTDKRTSPSVIPAACRCDAGTSAWVIDAGCVINVSAEPRFSASAQSCTLFMRRIPDRKSTRLN